MTSVILVLASVLACAQACYWNAECPYLLHSTKTPYDTVRGDIRDYETPQNCEAISVWTLNRHGNRNPGDSVTDSIKYIASLKDEIVLDEDEILGQFTVSTVIICVSAYQLAVEIQETPRNFVHIIAMTSYLLVMILQVFLYCYQGNQLLIQSEEISYAAFQCPWYCYSVRFQKGLLVVMKRSQRATRLTAGGFASLSLDTFTSIIKASYTFFTVLKQVEDRKA